MPNRPATAGRALRLAVPAMALVAAVAAGLLTTAASGATGSTTFRGCISSNSDVTECALTDDDSILGADTGLDNLQSVAISADGRSVYAVSSGGDALARFNRNVNTGAVSFHSCISSNTSVTGCAQVPEPSAGGGNTALDELRSVAVSADGRSVYAASGSGDALARFNRNLNTGAVSFHSCISSNSDVIGCAQTDVASAGGNNTGLNGLNSVAVSADGRSVYTASGPSDALARFDRNLNTGAVSFQSCVSSNSGVNGCAKIDGESAGGTDTSLDNLQSVAVSANGRSVYTASSAGDALARFARNVDTGAVSFQGCVSSNSDVAGCTPTPDANEGGSQNSLDGLRSVAVSADGRSVYTASFGGDGLARFNRNVDTGAVSFQGCVSSDTSASGCDHTPEEAVGGANTALDGLRSVAVSIDGRSVYATSFGGDALARFNRNLDTGAVSFQGCVSSDTGVNGCAKVPGASVDGLNTSLDGLSSVAVSADGRSVYTASGGSDVLARFDRERPSNRVAFGKTTRNRKRGTAKLRVKIPGAGRLVLAGKGLRRVVRNPAAARTVTLVVAARAGAARKLRNQGQLAVLAKVTFKPIGNDSRTVSRRLTLVRGG